MKTTAGKRKGWKNYNKTYVDILLDASKEILPRGNNMWENVSLYYEEMNLEFLRNGESWKLKFHNLVFARKLLVRNGYRKYSTYCTVRKTVRDRYVFFSLYIRREYETVTLCNDLLNNS